MSSASRKPLSTYKARDEEGGLNLMLRGSHMHAFACMAGQASSQN